jgi:hypothetical protein
MTTQHIVKPKGFLRISNNSDYPIGVDMKIPAGTVVEMSQVHSGSFGEGLFIGAALTILSVAAGLAWSVLKKLPKK